LANPKNNTGTAIIIAPGGGHRVLCLGHEGDAFAIWLAEHGISSFVLKYRLSNEKDSPYSLQEHAMADARRAIRLVRFKSTTWKIDPQKIGILGFSAGGELAAYAAMDPIAGNAKDPDPIEQVDSKPDFQVLIYPGKSDTFTVKAGMPPAFIACGANDRPDISIGMAQVYLKYKEAGVPCELHIYANAGHGFGFRPNTTSAVGEWPKRLLEWLKDSHLLN